ncbi:hypothetical protein AMTRI_Chr13g125230 [Amborella trichopoda]
MAVFSPFSLSKPPILFPKPLSMQKQPRSWRCNVDSEERPLHPRLVLIRGITSLAGAVLVNGSLTALGLRAEEEEAERGSEDEDKGFLGEIQSLFDPNEKTKSGKVLPKSYLKSAREVIETLRESLKEDSKDISKFRKTADAAKESIRKYLTGWKGQESIVKEESYVALEKAIRSLANFYSKAGPFATLPEDVKSDILDDLNTAEAFL